MALLQVALFSTSPAGAAHGNNSHIRDWSAIAHWVRILDYAIFGFLLLFAATLPHSIKGAERSWKLALILWLIKLLITRSRPYPQPLTAPLLAYVVLSAISTVLSPDPFLSWDRMKLVCLFLAGIVVAQNVHRLLQVRWLVVLLVSSGLGAALFTGWQYTYGVGVRLANLPTSSRLLEIGFQPEDVITSFAGHSVHTPTDLARVVERSQPHTAVTVEYLRGWAVHPLAIAATPDDFVQSGLGTPALVLTRGKPIRAQGTLGHYVVFAEMLMQVGCVAWALMISLGKAHRRWRMLFAVSFVAMLAALFLTQTRASLAGLVLGCLIALLVLVRGKKGLVAGVALIAILAGATYWIQHARRVEWLDRNDVSTQFRILMWEDGLRLVREHPWFGVGMDTVRVHYREWNIRGFIRFNVQSHFHSNFLQIAVERGIPALLAWIWFCAAYLVFLSRLVSKLREKSRFACGVAAGILGSFVAFTASSFLHYSLGEESLAMLLFFFCGLAVAMDRMLTLPGAFDGG